MSNSSMLEPTDGKHAPTSTRQRILGYAVVLAVVGYTAAVLLGLPNDRRIDGTTLGVIGMGAIIAFVMFRPEIVNRVTRLEIAGWKLEIENKQEKQDKQLKDIQLILPILLPETERKHLFNLANHLKTPYTGTHDVRTELRRLRSLKLIQMKSGQQIGHMGDGKTVDLSDFVELTDLGRHWVERIKEIEAEGIKAAESSMQASAGQVV
jgi:hypothetical protein